MAEHEKCGRPKYLTDSFLALRDILKSEDMKLVCSSRRQRGGAASPKRPEATIDCRRDYERLLLLPRSERWQGYINAFFEPLTFL